MKLQKKGEIFIYTNKTSNVGAQRVCDSEKRSKLFMVNSSSSLETISAEIKVKFQNIVNETLFRVQTLHPHNDDLYWNKENLYLQSEHGKLFEPDFHPLAGRCNDLVFNSATNLLRAFDCSEKRNLYFACGGGDEIVSGRAGFFDIFTEKPVHEGHTHLWHGMYWLYFVFGLFTVVTCMSAVMLGCVIHQGRRAQIVLTEHNVEDSTTDED